MENGASSYLRFLNGDKNGLTDLIREYRDGLTLYLNSFINDIHIAEEVADEVFVTLYVDKPNFKGKSSFKTWLYGIGRNIAGTYLKKIKRHSVVMSDEYLYFSDEMDIEAEYIKSEQKILLNKAISKIKSEYAQILYLIYIEEVSHAEAAEILNKTSKQINDMIYRAKKALREEIEKGGVEYEGLI